MSQKLFCAGFFDDALCLSIIKNGKILDKKVIRGDFISDGIVSEVKTAGGLVREYINANKIKPRYVKVFFKTSNTMARLVDSPCLNKRDLKAYLKNNLDDLFPVSTEGSVTGASVVYSNPERMTLYAAATPDISLASYVKLFRELKIEIKAVYTFKELLARAITADKKVVAIVENSNKTSFILCGNAEVRAMRDQVFLHDSFIGDYENISQSYDFNDAGEFYFYGGRYAPFAGYFSGKGVLHNNENDIIDLVLNSLCGGQSLNLIPGWYKTGVKAHKAIRNSFVCAAVIILFIICLCLYSEKIKRETEDRIAFLSAQLQDAGFISSDALAREYTLALDMLLDKASEYDADASFDIFFAVFEHIPADIRLNYVSYEAERELITLMGTAKTDSAILDLTAGLSEYPGFSNIELTDVNYADLAYSFCITFSYVPL